MATSDTTHAPNNAPPRTKAGKETAKSHKLRSEADYLNQQADAAKIAMGRSFDEFKDKLTTALSLKTAAKDHPWLTVAAGAVAGFAAGAAVTPSKTDSALKRLREIERALRPDAPREGDEAHNGHDGRPQAGPTMTQTVLKEVFSLVRPLVTSGITAILAARSAAKETAEDVQTQQEQTPPDQTHPTS